MIPKSDMDYISLYAQKLKKDNSIFEQQKRLIESQMHSSSATFRSWFGTGDKFKANARKYLAKIGLIH